MHAPQVDDQSELEISPLMRCGYLLLIKERLKKEISSYSIQLVHVDSLKVHFVWVISQSRQNIIFSPFFSDLILGQWSVRCVVALTSNQRTLCWRTSLWGGLILCSQVDLLWLKVIYKRQLAGKSRVRGEEMISNHKGSNLKN